MIVSTWYLLVLLNVLAILSILPISAESARHDWRFDRLSVRLAERRNRMLNRRLAARVDHTPKVCYELIGCFADPHSPSVKRAPQHPYVIKTQFFLYTRSRRKTPEIIQYGDNFKSYEKSHFNTSNNLKIIVHGYKGSGNDVGALLGVDTLLNLEDTNVIILDWTRGANSSYGTAVANVELVGRQLALILLDAINLGIDPNMVHIIGFSLGAHVAGCASEVLKKKNVLVGRITGLDPASPFFRHGIFRERSRKLDASDAKLVDVIHTDGSADFADGFGLLKPIGHIDFFPNGGREQPGCTDVKNSVVISHLNEEYLDRKIACSHLRAWTLFVESMQSQLRECKFTAWPCPQGANSFAEGSCFPPETEKWTQEMGYAANRGPLGIYYLVTRHEPPYCGDPLRAVIITSNNAPRTSGVLFLQIKWENATAIFQIPCHLPDSNNSPLVFYDLVATECCTFQNTTGNIESTLWYQTVLDDTVQNDDAEPINPTLLLNKLVIEDRKGNRWQFCNIYTEVGSTHQSVILKTQECDI